MRYTYRRHSKRHFRKISNQTAKDTANILSAGDVVCFGCYKVIKKNPQAFQDEHNRLFADDEASDAESPAAFFDQPSSSVVAEATLSKVLPLLDTAPLRKRKYTIEIV